MEVVGHTSCAEAVVAAHVNAEDSSILPFDTLHVVEDNGDVEVHVDMGEDAFLEEGVVEMDGHEDDDGLDDDICGQIYVEVVRVDMEEDAFLEEGAGGMDGREDEDTCGQDRTYVAQDHLEGMARLGSHTCSLKMSSHCGHTGACRVLAEHQQMTGTEESEMEA